MESITIKAAANPTYDVTNIKSVIEPLKGTTAIDAKKGHLVFKDRANGVWTAYALSAALTAYQTTADAPGPYVGILLEDMSLTTSPQKAKIAIGGTVYITFVRDAGIDEAHCSNDLLINFMQQTQVQFLSTENI